MPQFNYKCGCGHEFTYIVSYDDRKCVTCPQCGNVADLQYGLLQAAGKTEAYDIVVPHINKKGLRGVNKVLKDRWWKYKLAHDVPDLIDKHGLKTAKNLGLVKKNKIVGPEE